MADISELIIKTVAAMAKRNPDQIRGDTRLAEDLDIKSANRIGLSAILEDQFQVEITIFDIMKVKTIGELVALVENKQSK
jgi:acyl carrier protein